MPASSTSNKGLDMGMFDNLKVECPLPDPRFQNNMFQTKDLECGLFNYRLTKDGLLVLDATLSEEFTIPEQQTHVTERIRFYSTGDVPGIQWVEFEAVIVDGKLQSIKLVILDEED